MSELQKFIFDGMPVRGMVVRLTDSWREVLQRRADSGAWAPAVRDTLGQMAAASVLMQANLKFNGALILQVHGDGPVKLAVAEAMSDLRFRVTAKVQGDVPADARFGDMVNEHGHGRCAITLDPLDRQPGQQPYQGVVPLASPDGGPVGDVATMLEHYMRQSEQLETRIVLAANGDAACGLLIQRLPVEGEGNLAGQSALAQEAESHDESFTRIAHLAATLTADELLTLDVPTILHRLFWEEPLRVFEPQSPAFACSCSADRVRNMLRNLGREEAESILDERGDIEIGCDFCGTQYRFDAVDVGALFAPPTSQAGQAGAAPSVH
ncbi:MAG TPA: Hsp33 family molecular chaperone HslO [Burkholderiaceae bacterium]